jgi:glycosyltransferase involved in cell wall biosynthesis
VTPPTESRAGPATGAVAVVVPAHNEQDLIAACLAGIARSAAHPALSGVRVHLVVVLDDCRDATAERVAEARARSGWGSDLTTSVVAVSVRNVGRARALGVARALAALGPFDPETVWLASTDADSVVPPDWLAHQLHLRALGADGCAGTVVVDTWREHSPGTQPAYEADYQTGRLGFGHAHVHGTNLGVSVAAYRAAGGFSPLISGEDHALWQALAGRGHNLVATPLAPVTTSGRRYGRSPAGFAARLRQWGPIPA